MGRGAGGNGQGAMPAGEHLAELRRRMGIAALALILLFGACLAKSGDILALILEQGRKEGYVMIALSPQDALLQQLRASLACGALLSLPLIIYEAAAFISPAVDRAYAGKFWGAAMCGLVLFAAGLCFVAYVLFPFILSYMGGVARASGIAMEVSVESYVSFYLGLSAAIGLIFEMPVACMALSAAGIVTSAGMRVFRKPMIVMAFIVAAIITPPDVVSQVIVAVPMILLYEASIALCRIAEKGRKDKEREGNAAQAGDEAWHGASEAAR